jgi:tripartite-type tricarboxylate transporter receptor subunit TctC
MLRILCRVLMVCVALGAPRVHAAGSVEAFYKGRQLVLQTGSEPGDGYDLYGRLVSRFIGKYIPGNPAIVVQYVPGGGSLLLANQFGNITPRDGSVFGLFNNGMPTTPLLNPSVAQFDPRKFKFIGSPNREVQVFVIWHDAPAKTLEDLFVKEVIVGASAPGAAPYDYPLLTNALIGTKFKIITGYPGTAAVGLAMQRGEVHANPGVAWVSAKTAYGEMLAEKKMQVIAQFGFHKHPDLQDVPQFPTGTTEADRQIFQLLYARQDYGRPFAFPPDVPDDRVEALRHALAATMKDPEFLAEAAKIKADISLVTGEELQKLTDRLYQTPPEVVARMQSLLGTKAAEKRK